jgi:hypothetical protein
MTGNNNINQYVDKKPFEIVQEVNNEIPSYEEFMKNYQEDGKAIDSYNSEFESYGDIRIKGTYYGPGFWDDIKGIVKPIATGALVVASVFPPTAAVTAPVAYTVLGTGIAAHTAGEITDSDFLKEIGRDLAEIGSGARDGQGAAESPQGVKQGSLNEYARSRK